MNQSRERWWQTGVGVGLAGLVSACAVDGRQLDVDPDQGKDPAESRETTTGLVPEPSSPAGSTPGAGVEGAVTGGRALPDETEAAGDAGANSTTANVANGDPSNCGGNGVDCTTLPNVAPGAVGIECRAGICFVPAEACLPRFAHCSSRAADGCEADLGSSSHCGSCTTTCSNPTPVCSNRDGNFACASACSPPTADLCDATCVDLASDPRHCATCDHDCTSLPNVRANAADVECRSGVCVIPASACVAGFGHCSDQPEDGCETDLTAPATCGSCTNGCTAPVGLCSSSEGSAACSSSCVSPTPDLCDGRCIDTASDVANCGGCGAACTLPNAQTSCFDRACQIAQCRPGFGDCTGAPGCESPLNSNANCGRCGNACAANQACDAASGECSCVGSTRSCPGQAGCFAESVASCGALCSVCPNVANGTAQCLSGGRCDATCSTGFMRCDAQPRTCVRSAWSFESNTAEGFVTQGDAVDGLSVSTLRAAPGAGTHSLAMASTFNCDRRLLEVGLAPCGVTTSNLQGKTLTFQLFLDGPALFDGQREAVAEVLSSVALTSPITLSVGRWIPVSFPITDAAATTASRIAFSLFMIPSGPPPANLCMQWQGTIFVDDFAIR